MFKYECDTCGANNCRLFRDSGTFTVGKFCYYCAAVRAKVRPDSITKNTYEIGFYVVAVRTPDNAAYWGWTSIPHEDLKEWEALPVRPTTIYTIGSRKAYSTAFKDFGTVYKLGQRAQYVGGYAFANPERAAARIAEAYSDSDFVVFRMDAVWGQDTYSLPNTPAWHYLINDARIFWPPLD